MYTQEEKINHLKMLYHAANSDGIYNRAEVIYITQVADSLGVDLTELENLSASDFDLDLPDKEYKLYSLFHRLTLIMLVDNNVNDTERHFCFDMGVRMGLHPQSINEVIDYVIKQGVFSASPKHIIEIFKKYSN